MHFFRVGVKSPVIPSFNPQHTKMVLTKSILLDLDLLVIENTVEKKNAGNTVKKHFPSINIFKRLFPQRCQNVFLCDKGLTLSQTSPGFYMFSVQVF